MLDEAEDKWKYALPHLISLKTFEICVDENREKESWASAKTRSKTLLTSKDEMISFEPQSKNGFFFYLRYSKTMLIYSRAGDVISPMTVGKRIIQHQQ